MASSALPALNRGYAIQAQAKTQALRARGHLQKPLPSRRAPIARYTSNGSEAPVSAVALASEETKRLWRLSLDDDALAGLSGQVPTDFYELLGLTFDNDHRPLLISVLRQYGEAAASTSSGEWSASGSSMDEGDLAGAAIKAAYRRLQKMVHPDIAGEAATDVAALLNLAFRTLADEQARAAYDEELRVWRRGVGTYDGRAVSFWAGPPDGQLAVFVDETACIGCMNCTNVAPDTFSMEDEWGRARVHTQWGDEESLVREAVATCPVDCIYFVDRQQLPLLEFVMKSCPRENVALMGRRRSGNMGSSPAHTSPFIKAEAFVRARKRAGIDQLVANGVRMHDDALASTISRAWLALPAALRARGWPHLSPVSTQ